ncbi:uncharacterized protein BJ212DRAFT_1300978 [Suillus subaureus]|uniref:F-box domain-containing protein n=1 Tax=Suillus subaureus TaxID=48587 RepID=A0A9P7E7M3_9AGAM|nr:uncharacterized protein BJ212DRAFT_1300978 [Suillus subaureus]KAG1813583.1 hypothetical protein BJ212DRAFT_1300978 [Suillus subaureus]
MANVALVPQMFNNIWHVYHPELKRQEFTWVHEDIVVCIATHLYDERCLQASVSRLINAIMEQKDNPGHCFGITFSVFHCIIVKVIKDTYTVIFSHMSTLQFLPSFFAHSPSMPGITALTHLGYHINHALFKRAVEVCHYAWYINIKVEKLLTQRADRSDDVSHSTICPTLPLELWRDITRYLSPFDLIILGLVSRLCHEAALMVLHYPHLCGYCLVAIPQEKSKYLQRTHTSLQAASFCTVQASIPTIVDVWGGVSE